MYLGRLTYYITVCYQAHYITVLSDHLQSVAVSPTFLCISHVIQDLCMFLYISHVIQDLYMFLYISHVIPQDLYMFLYISHVILSDLCMCSYSAVFRLADKESVTGRLKLHYCLYQPSN